VRTKTGARRAAVEVLLNTRHVSELIEKGDVNEIKDAMEKSMAPGSQTFEQSLFKMFMDGAITQEECMANADSATNMLWLINQATAGELSSARCRCCRPTRRTRRRTARFPLLERTPRSAISRLTPALELAQALIARRSVTPEDGGCQALIAERLSAPAFIASPCGSAKSAISGPAVASAPLLCLCRPHRRGPTGPLSEWHSDPFVPTLRDGKLYGRGAADMKSSIAAFVVATSPSSRSAPARRLDSPSC
jgi:hypothetical protein